MAMTRRAFAALGAAIALDSGILRATRSAAAAGNQPLFNSTMRLGVFSGGFNPGSAAAFEAWLGRKSAYNVDFVSQAGYTGSDTIESSAGYITNTWSSANRPDRNMLFSIPIATNQDTSLVNVAAGLYDARYRSVAHIIAAPYPKAIIRLGWEFNGGWYPWAANGRILDYIHAFRRISQIFKAVAKGFTIDWCPNLGSNDFPAENAYPGDDVVDVIGMDAYDGNILNISDPVKRWPVFRDQDHGLTWHAQFAGKHKKPMSYPEWATGEGAGDNPYFIYSMYSWMTSNNVAYASYWDSDLTFQGQLSQGQYPQAAAEYKRDFGTYEL
jgi:hypothetical protein